MDALALLCHLSADGAGTLVRLRHAGYATLQDVLLADDEELGEILDASSREVARLRQQAESLEDRIGDASEAEPRPALSGPAPPAPVPRPASRPTPLLCKLETEPLSDEELTGGASPAPIAAAAEPRAAGREPQASSRPRYWMPIRPEVEELPPDPGPSGPFA